VSAAPGIILGATPPGEWLTVPQILQDLRVSIWDWLEWQESGDVPPCAVIRDGLAFVRTADYEAWLDAHTSHDLGEFFDTLAELLDRNDEETGQ